MRLESQLAWMLLTSHSVAGLDKSLPMFIETGVVAAFKDTGIGPLPAGFQYPRRDLGIISHSYGKGFRFSEFQHLL